MCGICGVVALERPPERETVARMLDQIPHRGPDAVGVFAAPGVALGNRRLAIIDLSDAGTMPFASEDGRYQLTYNGEVYNYRELRAELEAKGHRFRSKTDTEVLLASYVEWGERCVERFNGAWAFAIWDDRERRLFGSRDRFGKKPFYYRHADGRFAFASELKAFRGDSTEPLRANEPRVRDYLEQGYLDHTDETLFAGIRQVPQAHSFVLDRDGLRFRRYWQLEPRDPPAGDPAEAVRELFVDAVRIRLRADVPVGTALSGGLDSSAIACAINHLLRTETESSQPIGERQQTFTAYFEDAGFDERPFARAVVEQTGAEPHWVSFDADDVIASLPAVVEVQDEPFGSTSIVAQWFVMKAAREAGMTVLLDGQGGDELLSGYQGFSFRFADLIAQGRVRELAAEVGAYRSLHGASVPTIAAALARPFLPHSLKWRLRGRLRGGSALVAPELRALPPTLPLDGSPFPDRLRRQLHFLLTERGLPEELRYEDRNSMAHSVEGRAPFLDYRLVELLFSLEGRHVIDRGFTKAVLRRALGDLLPAPVRDRVDKVGFAVPEARFFRGKLGELAADVFASPSFAQRGFVDAAAARDRLERHRRGEISAGFELWRALNLELWARAYLDGGR